MVTVKINLVDEVKLTGKVALTTDTLTINLMKNFHLNEEEK